MAVRRLEEIKAELQSSGIRMLSPKVTGQRNRQGGAGPAEGTTLVLENSPVSVPFLSSFVADSPFVLARDRGSWSLYRGEELIDLSVELPSEPSFYGKRTEDGVPYKKIALFHGTDCLASTVMQSCAFWGTPLGCRFCGIGLSWKSGQTVLIKEPDLLAQVVAAAVVDGVRHVTLTAGTTAGRQVEWDLLCRSTRAVVARTGLPVHAQLMPPIPRDWMESLREAGVVSLGLHLESFDREVLETMAPCKAEVPVDTYRRAWRDAVEVFGRGQVSSYLLMGMGETMRSLREGCEELASLGVYPFLVPFRPIPGTPLESRRPLDPDRAKDIYKYAARVLNDHELCWSSVKAGCVRCRACSALPDYEDALAREECFRSGPDKIRLEVVSSGPSLDACFAIRQEVFVKEQNLFQDTDRDSKDPDSIHILARKGPQCLGTVRITSLGDGSWLGSRLAVKRPYRGKAGFYLVRKAEKEVAKRGGRRFIAYIQLGKVNFFKRCGWLGLEEIHDYHGKPHMLMKSLRVEAGAASVSVPETASLEGGECRRTAGPEAGEKWSDTRQAKS